MPAVEGGHTVPQASKDFLKGMGLGMIADQLAELKLGELLNTPPPGLDEAVAIGKVGSPLALPGMSERKRKGGGGGCAGV